MLQLIRNNIKCTEEVVELEPDELAEMLRRAEWITTSELTKEKVKAADAAKNGNYEKVAFRSPVFRFTESLFGSTPGVIRTCIGFFGTDTLQKHMATNMESVLVEYDPLVTPYETILNIFWKNHDFASTQFKQSAIFYFTDEQRRITEESLKVITASGKVVKTVMFPAVIFNYAPNSYQKHMLQRHPYICTQLGIAPGEELLRSFTASKLNGYVGGYGTMEAYDRELKGMWLPYNIEVYVRNTIPKDQNEKRKPRIGMPNLF